ncbi:hypothetical protein DSECCO2_578970 [anaerobic digester metagenome]
MQDFRIDILLGGGPPCQGIQNQFTGKVSAFRHLQVHPVFQCSISAVQRIPIADNQTIEPPFPSQNRPDQIGVFAAIDAVHLIVARHKAQAARLQSLLEGRQIELPEAALINFRVGFMTVIFAIIAGKMLYSGNHRIGTDPSDIACGHLPGQVRVFAKVLEVPSTDRNAGDVHTRAEQHSDSEGTALMTHYPPYLVQQVIVKRGCKGNGGGKVRYRSLPPPESDGGVAGPNRLKTQPFDTRNTELITTGQKRNLLLKRHL